MKRRKNISLALFVLCTGYLFAQKNLLFKPITKEEASKYLLQINHWFTSTASYSFTITHATYKGHEAASPYEMKRGFCRKFPKGYHSNIAGIHTLEIKNYIIKIDSSKKLIAVTDYDPKNRKGFSLDEYGAQLDKYAAFKLAESEDYKTVRFEAAKNQPISAFEFSFYKDGSLHAVNIYYAREVKTLQGESVKPKLGIQFDKYATSVIPQKNELNESQFFTVNSNNTLLINPAYKEYTLLDQRINEAKP
jgi:hypothetical protein